MTTHAKGTLEMKNWDEKPYGEVEGAPNLSRASVTNAFHGGIEGEGTLEYLMAYRAASRAGCAAGYVGMERGVGGLGGRSGSFVLQESGAFENGAATSTWSVVPGSGPGELRGLRGAGGFVARHGETSSSYTLD